jgi:hypothetical protein
MPRFDLRLDEKLDSLATFKVLAVMCQPTNRVRREQMLATVQSETGVEPNRRRGLTNDEFYREVELTSARAGVAGGLLLTLLQLHLNGYRPSLNRAIPLVRALLPVWEQPSAPYWSKESHVGHRPHSRRKMLECYQAFRSVAHLWAAALHGQQHQHVDICPSKPATLPIFLGYADCILRMASLLPPNRRDGLLRIIPSKSWTFSIPQTLVTRVTLGALPFNEEQLNIISERASSNDLK